MHRLVAFAFLPSPPAGFDQVNHKDGDKQNNRIENLEWSNASHNQKHALSSGLARVLRGVDRPLSKLTEAQVREIRSRCEAGENQRGLAREFGVAPCKITMIKQRTAWTHVE